MTDVGSLGRKEVGRIGEDIAAAYLVRHGMDIIDRNVARKTGELDVIAQDEETVLHFVEVKTIVVDELPRAADFTDDYDPADNLHPYKIRKVARTAEWYAANIDWEGEWQVDGCLVWLRRQDGRALVKFLPQII